MALSDRLKQRAEVVPATPPVRAVEAEGEAFHAPKGEFHRRIVDKLDLQTLHQHGRRDDEDDQQHEHDVDKRSDVDLRQRLELGVGQVGGQAVLGRQL